MAKAGVALTTGKAVGQERLRGKINIANFRERGFYNKCPFMTYYYVTSGRTRYHGSQLTAREKYESLEKYKREVCQINMILEQKYGKTCTEARTLLKNILVAQLELSYYDADEYIMPLGNMGGSATLERCEIKNKMSALRQRLGFSNTTGVQKAGRSFGVN